MRIPCLRSSRDRTTVGKFFTSFMGSARRGSWPRPQVARRSFLSLLSFCSNSLFPKALDADKHLSLCRFSEGRDPGLSKPFPPEFSLSPERVQCALTGGGCLIKQSSWNMSMLF
jgi:hypothetical protein